MAIFDKIVKIMQSLNFNKRGSYEHKSFLFDKKP